MRETMRPLYFIFVLSLCSSTSYADETKTQINKACLRHAVSLVAQLKADVVNNLTQAQSDQALKIATDSCQAYFNKEFSGTPVATVASTEESKKSYTDSFTEKFLNSDAKKKDGNKRLMKKR
tara:strand:- start:2762 stop:3127 length:366 start_codon:yes stop_codon:yes gene_type:complete